MYQTLVCPTLESGFPFNSKSRDTKATGRRKIKHAHLERAESSRSFTAAERSKRTLVQKFFPAAEHESEFPEEKSQAKTPLSQSPIATVVLNEILPSPIYI